MKQIVQKNISLKYSTESDSDVNRKKEASSDIIELQSARASERQIKRNSFIWNTAAGLLSGFQSVIMLMLIMRACDMETAGTFAIAYTVACLFLTIGQYGMRQFQVSDRKPCFSFRDYVFSRIITTALMMIATAIYLLVASITLHYSWEKSAVILIMCVFKMVDSIEDIVHGNYQQYGRLDVGARFLTIRLATALAVFAGTIVVSADLLPSMIATTIYTGVFFIWETWYIKRTYDLPRYDNTTGKILKPILKLLKDCFPLFLGAFLLLYISNAPKYAIDAFMDDTAQAYYGFIAMPVFFVGLLASFVYNPLIAPLSNAWALRDVWKFLRGFRRICLIIIGIAATCTLLTWLIGAPILNFIYATDVTNYRNELTALVAGGAFYALTSLATLGIAIIRRQNMLIGGYIMVALTAFVASNYAVPLWGITGATWVYFFSAFALSVIFTVCFLVSVWQESRQH